jgi:hypothetical protein
MSFDKSGVERPKRKPDETVSKLEKKEQAQRVTKKFKSSAGVPITPPKKSSSKLAAIARSISAITKLKKKSSALSPIQTSQFTGAESEHRGVVGVSPLPPHPDDLSHRRGSISKLVQCGKNHVSHLVQKLK